ncbi:MAG: hypothetical protein ACI9VM_000772 [Candidatus Azotimanducaceae bacterium]|jgi:hypothetical protein
MFELRKHGPDGRYGAIFDIGSGSVGVAIVASDPTQKHPEIIWSHRERMIFRDAGSANDRTKHITTALVNTMLMLGSKGLMVLQTHEKGASIDLMQVAISAPWSYTITKSVSYTNNGAFVITKQLIKELTNAAQKQALEAINENDIVEKLGLKIITRATIDFSANNYPARDAFGQKAKSVSISHVSAISQNRLLEAITESKEKVIPGAVVERYSFMLMFYCVLRELVPDTSEVCLIDITFEATEIGIVRDGVLKYATHAPFGTYTIARDIAALCDIPKEEALAYILGNTALSKTLSADKKAKLQSILTNYEEKITALFKRTGDSLSVPRPLFIHSDMRTEFFYADTIKRAAIEATKGEHGVHLVSSKLFENTQTNDTALLLSAYFFHKMHACDDFEQM